MLELLAEVSCLFYGIKIGYSSSLTLTSKSSKVQPDQIDMAVLFWYLVQSDTSVRYCTLSLRGQVLFTRYQKHTAMYLFTLYKLIQDRRHDLRSNKLKKKVANIYVDLFYLLN